MQVHASRSRKGGAPYSTQLTTLCCATQVTYLGFVQEHLVRIRARASKDHCQREVARTAVLCTAPQRKAEALSVTRWSFSTVLRMSPKAYRLLLIIECWDCSLKSVLKGCRLRGHQSVTTDGQCRPESLYLAAKVSGASDCS